MIIYEDDYTIAINKPNNVLVHHSAMAKNQANEKSLVQLLFITYNTHYYPIHRLDRKTSGILLLAKKKEYVAPFQELFINNNIQKTYYGLVRGYIAESGVIDTPVKGRDANTHKEALTYYKKVNTTELNIAVHPFKTARYSIVKLLPQTGRLHQLRIHLNKISHPLIGDPKYGDRYHNRMFEAQFNATHLFLHAYSIEFIHPFTKKLIHVIGDFPKHWSVEGLGLKLP